MLGRTAVWPMGTRMFWDGLAGRIILRGRVRETKHAKQAAADFLHLRTIPRAKGQAPEMPHRDGNWVDVIEGKRPACITLWRGAGDAQRLHEDIVGLNHVQPLPLQSMGSWFRKNDQPLHFELARDGGRAMSCQVTGNRSGGRSVPTLSRPRQKVQKGEQSGTQTSFRRIFSPHSGSSESWDYIVITVPGCMPAG